MGISSEQEAVESAIKQCIESNGAAMTGMKARDPMAFESGKYDQTYDVEVFKDVNQIEKRGVAVVEAYKENGTWQADLKSMNLN